MTTDDISRTVANKLGLKYKQVDDIHRFQYQFLVDTITEGKETIHLIHIGKFIRKEERDLTAFLKKKDGVK